MSPVKPSLRKRIKNLLHSNVCIITFVKANGDEREMLCTLLEQFLPPQETGTDNPVEFRRKSSDEAMAVWDLEKKDWRSFRFDSVTSMKIRTGDKTVDILKDETDD